MLLHIGPYKTGSTSLQAALFAARPEFEKSGVYYPGSWRRAMRPGWAVMGWSPRGRKVPPIGVWEKFADDVRQHHDMRTCVSTEDFGAVVDQATRIVQDLGDERVHVVSVARRMDQLLPSAWQERVKSHDERPFSTWLEEILGDPDSVAHRAFWRSQDTVAQAERWLKAVPPERYHVITTDNSDRALLFRTFEGLLGLPDGLLQPTPVTNASLSANAVELLRQLNVEFRERGWDDSLYHDLVHRGVIPGMADRPADAPAESVPRVPSWALPALVEIGQRAADGLAALGVDIIGDPATLVPPAPPEAKDDAVSPEVISVVEARGAVTGAVEAALEAASVKEEKHRAALGRARRKARRKARTAAGRSAPGPSLASSSGRELAGELLQRVRARIPNRFRQ
ncbi:MAG: hypothetical protein ACRDPH_10725 [Marmoricola sp.]